MQALQSDGILFFRPAEATLLAAPSFPATLIARGNPLDHTELLRD
jgi:hypothetical protein